MVAEKDYIEIPLGGRKYPGRVALVDGDVDQLVMETAWTATVKNKNRSRGDDVWLVEYAVGRNKKHGLNGFPLNLYLHRVVMGVTDPGIQIDHINRNGLDCRRPNLRISSQQQNVFNTRPHRDSSSKFKGVHWHSGAKRWRAFISHDGRHVHLGLFKSEIDAAVAYDNGAMELFVDFAYLNFPERKAS